MNKTFIAVFAALAVLLTGCSSATTLSGSSTDSAEERYIEYLDEKYPGLAEDASLRQQGIDLGYQQCEGFEEYGVEVWLKGLFSMTEEKHIDLTVTTVAGAAHYLCPQFEDEVKRVAQDNS